MRTAEEILARIEWVEKDGRDFFGAERTDLLSALPYEHAKASLKEGTTAAEWDEVRYSDDEAVKKAAVDYLEFAVGKALDHRGLSADRSIAHYRAWLWLLGHDVEELLDNDQYAMYGAPLLVAAAKALEVPDRPFELAEVRGERSELERMANGDRCEPNCYMGC